jgi:hypothetical protein
MKQNLAPLLLGTKKHLRLFYSHENVALGTPDEEPGDLDLAYGASILVKKSRAAVPATFVAPWVAKYS